MNALKAVEEPRYKHPMIKMTAAFMHNAQIGASHRALSRERCEQAINPLSRENVHVNREAVWGDSVLMLGNKILRDCNVPVDTL